MINLINVCSLFPSSQSDCSPKDCLKLPGNPVFRVLRPDRKDISGYFRLFPNIHFPRCYVININCTGFSANKGRFWDLKIRSTSDCLPMHILQRVSSLERIIIWSTEWSLEHEKLKFCKFQAQFNMPAADWLFDWIQSRILDWSFVAIGRSEVRVIVWHSCGSRLQLA